MSDNLYAPDPVVIQDLAQKALALRPDVHTPDETLVEVEQLLNDALALVPAEDQTLAIDLLSQVMHEVAETVANAAVLVQAAVDIAQEALGQRDQAIRELAALEAAMDDPDETDDPRVIDLVERLEEGLIESMSEAVYDDGYNEGWADGRSSAHNALRDEYGQGFDDGYRKALDDYDFEE